MDREEGLKEQRLCRRLGVGFVTVAVAAVACLGYLLYAGDRSHDWSSTRRVHIDAEPYCRVCGSVKELEVHHEREFARYPELELAQSNLITLCRHCHYAVGHLEVSWKTNNYEIQVVFGTVSNSTGRKVWEQRKGGAGK